MTVRGVRHINQKVPLKAVDLLDFLVGVLECLEHPVHGMGQTTDLIGAFARKETTRVVLRGRDLAGCTRQLLQGMHRAAHQQPDH